MENNIEDRLGMVDNMEVKGLILEYPELFGTTFDPRETAICFGFEIGNGWLQVFKKYLPELSKEILDNELKDFKIVQVKEKFGSIRIYTQYTTEGVETIINKIEAECETTCEECGSPEGKFRQDGWLRVLCDKCEANRKK